MMIAYVVDYVIKLTVVQRALENDGIVLATPQANLK